MNINNIIQSIQSDNLLSSNYLLFGEEEFFINQISSCFLNNLIAESEKSFNQKILYGKDTNVFSLMTILKSFPMMGQRQLVVLKEAHKLDNIEALESYFKNPVQTTVLVLCYHSKTVDKRKKWVKILQKNGILFESKKLYENQLGSWIQIRLSKLNLKIDKPAELLLIDALGDSLSNINNSINKLADIISGTTITVKDVQEHIGIHRDYNTFELQNALAEKNSKKAFLITDYFIKNQNKFPFPPIVGLLFSFFNKLLIIHSLDNQSKQNIASSLKIHPYFVPSYLQACSNYSFPVCVKVISLLKDADLQFKGIRGHANYPLKDLIINIICN